MSYKEEMYWFVRKQGDFSVSIHYVLVYIQELWNIFLYFPTISCGILYIDIELERRKYRCLAFVSS